MSALLSRLGDVPEPFTSLTSKTAWPYLLSSLVLATVLWLVRRARDDDARVPLRRYLFPGDVFGHPSARLDYRFVLIDIVLRALLYLPLIASAGLAANRIATHTPIVGVIGRALAHLPGRSVVVGVTLFLLVDLSLYLVHLTEHRVPWLWAFHEVHHSAEVLTPLTVHRVHPVEETMNYLGIGIFSGVGTAIWAAATSASPGIPTILGVNALTVLFYGIAYQLRHSHIWLSYGPRWSKVFISPAQHQIHHSRDERHWDRNMGFVFAFWDGLFGTLYVPTEREHITFGVAGADPADFTTVRHLYVLPFVKAYRRLPLPALRRRRFAA